MAVRDLTHRAQAAVLVPTIMQRFSTDLSAADLSARMEWLWLMLLRSPRIFGYGTERTCAPLVIR